MKIAFHKFLVISLLEQWPNCKGLGFFSIFTVAMVTKIAAKIGWK